MAAIGAWAIEIGWRHRSAPVRALLGGGRAVIAGEAFERRQGVLRISQAPSYTVEGPTSATFLYQVPPADRQAFWDANQGNVPVKLYIVRKVREDDAWVADEDVFEGRVLQPSLDLVTWTVRCEAVPLALTTERQGSEQPLTDQRHRAENDGDTICRWLRYANKNEVRLSMDED